MEKDKIKPIPHIRVKNQFKVIRDLNVKYLIILLPEDNSNEFFNFGMGKDSKSKSNEKIHLGIFDYTEH